MDRHRMTWSFGGGGAILRVDCLFSRGSSVVGGCWGGLMGVSIDKLDTDLFGEGELNLLAGGDTDFSLAVGNNDLRIDNGGNLDGLFLRDVSGGNNGDIVGGFLGNLFAVVVSVSPISSMS